MTLGKLSDHVHINQAIPNPQTPTNAGQPFRELS